MTRPRIAQWLDRLEQVLCGFRGHPGAMRHTADGRLSMHCYLCGWTSTGIQVIPPRPARRILPIRLLRGDRDQRRRRA